MNNLIKICECFNSPYEPNSNIDSKICSDCEVDEALHSYLQALRRKENKLTISEKLFLLIKG